MNLEENPRVQEWFLMIGDRATQVSRAWWYALGIAIVAVIPAYFIFKLAFVETFTRAHRVPAIIYTEVAKEPLQVIEQKIFKLGPNSYSGFARIKNINLEWGVATQAYTAEFKTVGGTLVTKVTGNSFILPASEKLLVFARFSSESEPQTLDVSLDDTKFIRKPNISVNYGLERVNFSNNPGGAVVSAGITNLSPFTVKQINLPVVVYDNQNTVVGVNSTYISEVASGETRTFQYTWPLSLASGVRAEITPEINVFDRNLFSTDTGVSPFDGREE